MLRLWLREEEGKMEPDLIKNSIHETNEDDFGPHLIRLKVTDQIKELQTVLRDR